MPASDADWLEWLEHYVTAASVMLVAADDGVVRLSGVNFEPIRADAPLRAWVGGVYWDPYGRGYPLVRPLELALTPIAPGDRVEVEIPGIGILSNPVARR